MSTVTTVRHGVRRIGGVDCPVVITHIVGLAKYERYGEEFWAEAATFIDGGKYGVTCNFTIPPEVEPTPEERAAGRRHIQEVAARALTEQGLW